MDSDEATAWTVAAAGDGAAFGRVFDLHHDRAYRHALRLTQDTHDAEDVLAAAFLELWRRRAQVRVVDGSVLPWLLVTVTNVALNQRRSVRRYRAVLDRLPRGTSSGLDAAELALNNPELDVDPWMLAAIRALRPTDQRLVALVALEDYDLASAAAVVGLTEVSARSRWQRIRRRLAASSQATSHTTAASLATLTEGVRP